MKKNLATWLLIVCLSGFAAERQPSPVRFESNAPECVRECGEKVQFKLVCENLPKEAAYLMCEIFENGQKVEEKRLEVSAPYSFERTLTQPGWLAVLAGAFDVHGQPVKNPRPINMLDKNLRGGAGCLFSPELINHTGERPSDFEALWQQQRAELSKVPMTVKRVEREVDPRFKDRCQEWEVEIGCAGIRPVRGYLSIPLGAKAKSLPIVVFPHGAGVRSANSMAWRRYHISFTFNAHGIENGMPAEYYSQQSSTALRGYAKQGAGNRDTWYFKEMFLRLMRALEYVKTIPEWNGKELVIWADSMGGGQALVGAALDKDVTLCCASFPAFGDLNGPAPAYPKPKKGDYTAYFDTVNFAPMIKCPVHLSVGMIDFTCPPYTVVQIYNALPATTQKSIEYFPNYLHERAACVTIGIPEFLTVTGSRAPQKNGTQNSRSQSSLRVFKKWKFAITDDGKWQTLDYDGQQLLKGSLSTLSWQVGSRHWTSPKVSSIHFDDTSGVLKICGKENDYFCEESLVFDACGIDGLIQRKATLWRDAAASDPMSAFFDLQFHLPLPADSTLHAPTAIMGDTGNLPGIESRPHIPAEKCVPRHGLTLDAGEKITTASFAMPLLAEMASGGSLLFLSEDWQEAVQQSFVAGNGLIRAIQQFQCCGWGIPGKKQEIGKAYIFVSKQNATDTLRSGIVHKWCEKVGFVPPANRPKWIEDALIYETNATYAHGGKDCLDAMADYLLPHLGKLGFNTIWNMPVNTGGTYAPLDYYAINGALGNVESYKKMVNRAHANGIKVLQDTVPHGGTAILAQKRGNSVFALRFHTGGTILKPNSINALAANSLEWRKYVCDAASLFCSYGVDGFRIDQCSGSAPDWKRTDWPPRNPDKPPEGIDIGWWQKSMPMDIANPPLERASLSTRQSGREFIQRIRDTAREHNPQGATLAETSYSSYVPHCDILYDFMSRSWLPKFLAYPADELAPGFAKRLEEQYFTDPFGTLRMRYIDTHDSSDAVAYIGLDAARAITAAFYFSHGIPLAGSCTYNFFHGNGIFLKRMNDLRRNCQALRQGVPDYHSLATAAKEIFTVLRCANEEQCAGYVNFSGKNLNVPSTLPSGTDWHDAETGLKAPGTMELKPWEARLFVSHKVSGYSVKSSPHTKEFPESSKANFEETDDSYSIKAPTYQLLINKHTGLVTKFANGQISTGCRLLLPVQANAITAKTTAHTSGNGINIEAVITVPGQSGSINLSYHCQADKVGIHAVSSHFNQGTVMLLWDAPAIQRWQVDTIDGRWDDIFTAPLSGASDHYAIDTLCYEPYRQYLGTGNILFQSFSSPLHWSLPAVRAFANSQGIVWKMKNFLDRPGHGVNVYRNFVGENGWHLGFFLNKICPLTHGIPNEIFIELLPIQLAALPDFVQPEIQCGNLTLGKDGTFNRVAGKNFSVVFNRHGGGIKYLKDKTSQVLMHDLDMCSTQGFSKKIASSGDILGGNIIFKKENFLHVRNTSYPRNSHRGAYLPGLAAQTDYIISLDGETGFSGYYKAVAFQSLPTNDYCFGIVAKNVLPGAFAGVTEPTTHFEIPLLQKAVPVKRSHWIEAKIHFLNNDRSARISATQNEENDAVSTLSNSGTFEEFADHSILVNSQGTCLKVYPLAVQPPRHLTTYKSRVVPLDNNIVLKLNGGSSARLNLFIPEKAREITFKLYSNSLEVKELQTEVISGNKGNQIQKTVITKGLADWREITLPLNDSLINCNADLRFYLEDCTGFVCIDNVTIE